MMKGVIVIFLIFFIQIIQNETVSYRNHKLIKVLMKKEIMNEFSNNIILSHDGALLENLVSEIIVSPEQYKRIQNITENEVIVNDFQKLLDAEKTDIERANKILLQKLKFAKNKEEEMVIRHRPENWFTNYHTYEEHLSYVLKFKTDYPNMVEVETIGKSIEGRDLYVIKVHSPGAYNPNKNGLWLNSGQHAR
jgi:hypothetical protein